jgi:hypothetical protein
LASAFTQEVTVTQKKKSTAPVKKNTAYRFPIEINDGSNRSRVSRRVLSYPKPPQDWNSMDVLNVVREMARTAADVKRKKIAETEMALWFQAINGGTEVTVSPTFGAWACIRGKTGNRLHPATIAGLVSKAQTVSEASLRFPAVLLADPEEMRRSYVRMLKHVKAMQANIEADIAKQAAMAKRASAR